MLTEFFGTAPEDGEVAAVVRRAIDEMKTLGATAIEIQVPGLATLVAEISGSPVPPVHVAPRSGDVRHSLADVTAARTQLGYSPQVRVADGLERLCIAAASTST